MSAQVGHRKFAVYTPQTRREVRKLIKNWTQEGLEQDVIAEKLFALGHTTPGGTRPDRKFIIAQQYAIRHKLSKRAYTKKDAMPPTDTFVQEILTTPSITDPQRIKILALLLTPISR